MINPEEKASHHCTIPKRRVRPLINPKERASHHSTIPKERAWPLINSNERTRVIKQNRSIFDQNFQQITDMQSINFQNTKVYAYKIPRYKSREQLPVGAKYVLSNAWKNKILEPIIEHLRSYGVWRHFNRITNVEWIIGKLLQNLCRNPYKSVYKSS